MALSRCSIRKTVERHGAVTCWSKGADTLIVHQQTAGCRRENPIISKLSGRDVEALLALSQAMQAAGRTPSVTFCKCAVKCGQPITHREHLSAAVTRTARNLERATRRAERARETYANALAASQATGYYGEVYADAKTAMSAAEKRLDAATAAATEAAAKIDAPTLFEEIE